MMTKREVIQAVLAGKKPPYVPWSLGFTLEAKEKMLRHFGRQDWEDQLGNHIVKLGSGYGYFEKIGSACVRDIFGVVWDRRVDQDIGQVTGCVLPAPTLKNYKFPNPTDDRFFASMPGLIAKYPDRYRLFHIGFSFYERAWSLRGMENLMLDFYDNPEFVRELFRAIADYNIAQIGRALTYEIDAVYFGDDWGQQHGLQMRRETWQEFLLPELKRMYGAVRAAGKKVFIHSCGDVDELFDELIDAGVNSFNPFQPEVMDVFALMKQYQGRLTFQGGLSTQKTLPYGTVADVKADTRRLLAAGREGGYIFAPAHAVEGDVSVENMLAFLEVLNGQEGYRAET